MRAQENFGPTCASVHGDASLNLSEGRRKGWNSRSLTACGNLLQRTDSVPEQINSTRRSSAYPRLNQGILVRISAVRAPEPLYPGGSARPIRNLVLRQDRISELLYISLVLVLMPDRSRSVCTLVRRQIRVRVGARLLFSALRRNAAVSRRSSKA